MMVDASSKEGFSCVKFAATERYTYGVLLIMNEMTRTVYVPVRRNQLFPLKAESNAMETTVPGKMNGAITDKSSNAAPFGFLRSVM